MEDSRRRTYGLRRARTAIRASPGLPSGDSALHTTQPRARLRAPPLTDPPVPLIHMRTHTQWRGVEWPDASVEAIHAGRLHNKAFSCQKTRRRWARQGFSFLAVAKSPAIRERPGDAYTTTSTGNMTGYSTKEPPAKEPYAHTRSNHTPASQSSASTCVLAHISVHLSTTFSLMRRWRYEHTPSFADLRTFRCHHSFGHPCR